MIYLKNSFISKYIFEYLHIMGIKKLLREYYKRFPGRKKYIKLNELSNNYIAIDAFIYIYRAKHKGNDIIKYFKDLIFKLRLHNIVPIFVFDGKSCKYKLKEIQKRKERLHNKMIKLQEIEDTNIRKHLEEKISRPDPYEIGKLKESLELWGIPFETINRYDAESFISYLSRKQFVQYIASEDSDVIAYGAKIWLRNIDRENIQIIDISLFKKKLDILQNKFIIDNETSYTHWFKFLLFCVLLGNDFNETIMPFREAIRYFNYKKISNIIEMDLIKKNTDTILRSIKIYTHSFPEYDEKYKKLVSIKPIEYILSNYKFPFAILRKILSRDEIKIIHKFFGIPEVFPLMIKDDRVLSSISNKTPIEKVTKEESIIKLVLDNIVKSLPKDNAILKT